jgi:brefeldin A-inhibited guanine nucleotide-exchange protein
MAQKSEIIANAIDPNKIDLIIQKSANLDGDAVVDFISNLCRVSSEELDDEENPRKFSLQRLVEVADFNMDNRIRFTWNKIWSMLSDHFS